MQVGRQAIVLGRARKVADRKVVVAVQLAHRVQRLIDVADEVDDELERLSPLLGREARICQIAQAAGEFVNDAVAFRRWRAIPALLIVVCRKRRPVGG